MLLSWKALLTRSFANSMKAFNFPFSLYFEPFCSATITSIRKNVNNLFCYQIKLFSVQKHISCQTSTLYFGDGSLCDVGFDVVVAQDVLDDFAERWEVLEQVNLRQIVQVVDDAREVNVSPGDLSEGRHWSTELRECLRLRLTLFNTKCPSFSLATTFIFVK